MLVLSRKRGERILIGDNITVTVVDLRDDKVRLGVEAPREVPVNRPEVLQKKNAAKAAAAATQTPQDQSQSD